MQDNENLRRVYNYGLTRNMLKVILQHKDSLHEHYTSIEPPINLDWKKISSSSLSHPFICHF